MKKMKISIIIPVFNEERTILNIIEQVSKQSLPSNIKKEIIVIDDGSTDQTAKILKNVKKPGIILLRHDINSGKGAAIKTGLKLVSGEIIIIQDADLEYHPKYYPELINPILSKKAEVVYGTRLKRYPLKLWGKDKTVMPFHLIANKLLSFLTNLLYSSHLTDMETGYKVFTKKSLEKISFLSSRFEIEVEITARFLKSGYQIYEVPIRAKPRTYQEGKKIKLKDAFLAFWALFKYRFTD